MRSCRCISSRPTSSPATASCCRKARPRRRSLRRPRSPARSRRSVTRIYYLADGAISSNTPIQVAVKKGARRLIILPTGHACATQTPPIGAVANALHALTLLIARQLVSELESLGPDIEYFVVPPLCPLVGSPYDFSRTADHITAPFSPPMPGWPSTACSRARSARDAAAQPLNGGSGRYAALQKASRPIFALQYFGRPPSHP